MGGVPGYPDWLRPSSVAELLMSNEDMRIMRNPRPDEMKASFEAYQKYQKFAKECQEKADRRGHAPPVGLSEDARMDLNEIKASVNIALDKCFADLVRGRR